MQIDDTNLAYLCDEKMREGARQRGDDPNELPRRYAKLINAAIAQQAGGHDARACTCAAATSRARGRRRAATSRSPRCCFNELDVDGYFLEYDDRALRRLRAAALRAEGQDRRAGPGHHQARPARVEGRPQAAHRRGREATCRSSSSACRRSAASRAPCTATTSPSSRRRRSCGWSSRRRARSGAAFSAHRV